MTAIGLGPRERIASEQFRRFYVDLVALRDQIAQPAPVTAEAACAVNHANATPGVTDIRAALTRSMLATGYVVPDRRLPRVVDVGYVMAAVADEVLLVQCPAWPGRHAWIEHPFEASLYGTRLAGEWIFAAAADIVEGRRDDPATAAVILLALLTGFRGRYHGGDDRGRIAELSKQLYAIVCGKAYSRDDNELYTDPNLALTTLTRASYRPLPQLWPWIAATAALGLLYLPVSQLAWSHSVAEVSDLAQAIVDLSVQPKAAQ